MESQSQLADFSLYSKLDQVKKIVEDRQLGPITVQVFTPKGGAMFGVIKMDGQTFSGYHERSTCQNSEEAQELVAAVALEYLEREKSSGVKKFNPGHGLVSVC